MNGINSRLDSAGEQRTGIREKKKSSMKHRVVKGWKTE